MAFSEEVAEKLASLILEQAPRTASFTLDTGIKLVDGAGKLTKEGLEKLLKTNNDNAELKHLSEIDGEITASQMSELTTKLGLKSSTVRVADSDAKEYEDQLRKNGVLYAKMDIRNDNAKMFIFLNRDKEKVQMAGDAIRTARGQLSEVRPDLYFNSISPENVRLIDGLDAAELELFRHYARNEKLIFTSIRRGDRTAIVYEQSQEPKAKKALLHTGWDLTGYNGAKNREQVELRLQGRTAISICAEEAQRELYIVSKDNPGNYVNITSEDFSVYKAGKKVSTISRSSPEFYERCMAAADGIEHGTVLTGEQYHTNMTKEELAAAPTIDLHLQNYEELIEIEKQIDFINLVANKYSIDDEGNASWGLSDSSVSYSEFSGFEFIMDKEEQVAREQEFEHFKKAAFYTKDHFTVQDIHMDEKNVDFIIQKAEEKRKAQTGADYEQEQSHTRL